MADVQGTHGRHQDHGPAWVQGGPRGGEFGPRPGQRVGDEAAGRRRSWAAAEHVEQAFGVGRLEQPGRERAIRGQPGHGDVGGHRGR